MPPKLRERTQRGVSTESSQLASEIEENCDNTKLRKKENRYKNNEIVDNKKMNGQFKVNGNINGHIDSLHSDTEEENDYIEIDHAKEDDDDTDIEEIDKSSSEAEDEDDNIADKIELLGDELEGAFSSKKDNNDDDIKSDQYFLAHCSKSKVTKASFATLLENFDLYESEINEFVGSEHKLLCTELNITPYTENDLLKFYHLLK